MGVIRIFRQADLVETPWKNGGGITRTIASQMDGDTVIWRLSMADVSTAGPFSGFPGLTRILTVIEGDAMILHAPDGDLRADYAEPVRFDGATAIAAELTDGPLRDFNLMFATDRCDAEAMAETGPREDALLGGSAETAVLHCIRGSAQVDDRVLMPGDTAIADSPPMRYSLPEQAIALAIVLRRSDQTEASNPAIARR